MASTSGGGESWLTRRHFLRIGMLGGLSASLFPALVACGSASPPASTPASAASAPASASSKPAASAAASASSAAPSTKPQASGGAGGALPKVRFLNTAGSLGDWAPYIGVKKGFFQEDGIDLQMITVGSTPAANSALISGQGDAAVGAIPTAISSTLKKAPVKLAMATQVATPGGKYNNWWCVLPNSSIKSVTDLKGKKVHINGVNSLAQVATHVYLRNKGIPPGQYEEEVFTFDQSYTALKTNRADIALFIEPYFTRGNKLAQSEYGAPLKVIYTYLDLFTNGLNLTGLWGNTNFMAQNGDTMRKFLRSWLRSAKWGQDNPDDTKKIIAEFAQIPYDDIKDMILASQSPDGRFFPGFLKQVQEYLISEKAIEGLTEPLPDNKITDLSFVPTT